MYYFIVFRNLVLINYVKYIHVQKVYFPNKRFVLHVFVSILLKYNTTKNFRRHVKDSQNFAKLPTNSKNKQ